MSSPIILVAEDDLHTRKIIEQVLRRDRMLRYQKLKVLGAEDGMEAFELFQKNEIDLVVTDLLMPRMDGFQLVQEIRKAAGTKVPILVTTAVFRDKKVLEQLIADYHVEIASKPFNLRRLADQVRRMLGERVEPKNPNRRVDTASNIHTVTEPSVTEEGLLSERSIPKIVFDFVKDNTSGILHLERGNVQKKVYFVSGHPIFVRSNLRGETLGQLLLRRGGISEGQHRRVLAHLQKTDRKYGETLVHLKIMSESQVIFELSAQFQHGRQHRHHY